MKRLSAKLYILAAFVALASLPAQADAEPVSLRTATEVNRTAIRLADVFDNLPEGLDRDIAVAPAWGKSVTYDARVLKKLAEQYRLDWRPKAETDHLILTRAATRISTEMIRDAVAEKILESAKNKKAMPDIAFDQRAVELFAPPERGPDFSLVNFSYDEQSRRFRGEVQTSALAQPLVLPLSGRVTFKREVPVLARRLSAGTTVGESDLTWQTINEDQIAPDVLTDAAQLVGQELRHDRVDNEPLRTRDVMAPRLVIRGSLVTLRVETPAMQITTQGRAMQDGAKGDVVRVTNVQTNRIIEGTVEAGGVVRVGPFPKIASVQTNMESKTR